jgi:hypothetical protein
MRVLLRLVAAVALLLPPPASGRCVGPCGNTTCLTPGGTRAPCGPGAQRCGPSLGPAAPLYHFHDDSCGMNDPNAPFYHAATGLYHLFYQAQLAMPQPGLPPAANFSSFGPVIGHAVSADLAHWAHLPIALWNSQPFDNLAVFTGSATLVDGAPYLVFPGICGFGEYKPCGTYFTARPANASDALLAEWEVLRVIANDTMDDPSGAWLTADGQEWRFIGATGAVYSAPAAAAAAPGGDGWSGAAPWALAPAPVFRPPTYNASDGGISCGDLFPRPRDCAAPACAAAPGAPSHVYKLLIHGPSGAWGDYFWLGNYSDAGGGGWAPAPFASALPCDGAPGASAAAAGKSFADARRGERVLWANVFAARGAMTLPRDLRWHGALGRLVSAPGQDVASALRRGGPPLFYARALALPASGGAQWLGDWPPGAGNASELQATFALPEGGGNVSFGAAVLVGEGSGGGSGSANASLRIVIEYDPLARAASLTVGGSAAPVGPYMPGVDLPGGDYNVTDVRYSDPRACQAACARDGERCAAFTYVVRPPLAGACCLKGAAHGAPVAAAGCTSGVLRGGGGGGGGGAGGAGSVPIPLLPGEAQLQLRVYVDRTLVEVFVGEGRAGTTVGVGAELARAAAGAAGMQLLYSGGSGSGGALAVSNVTVWQMTGFEVSAEEVLAQAKAQRAAAGAALPAALV